MKQRYHWLPRFVFLSLQAILQVCLSAHAEKPPLFTIRSSFTSSTLQGYLWHIDKAEDDASAKQILQRLTQGQDGYSLKDEVPNLGNNGLPQWVGFQLINRTSEPLTILIELDFIAPESISFYAWQSGQLSKKVENVSWRTPLRQRDVSNRVPAFRLTVQPNRIYHCAVRVQQRVGFLVFPLRIYEEHAFNSHTTFVHIAHGLTLGFMLLAMLVGVAFWLLTGERLYGYYALYALGIAGFELEEQGYLNQYFVGHIDILASQAAWPIFSQIAVIGHTLFIIHFLRLKTLATYRVWVLPGQLLVALSIGFLISLVLGLSFNTYVYNVSLAIALVYTVFSFIYLFLAAYYQRKEAYLYMLAVSPLFLSFIYIVVATIGWVPENWVLFLLISYAPAWEVGILCIGLAQKFSWEQRQRIVALEEAARLQANLVQAMDEAQESERRRIAQDLHDDIGNTLATAKATINLNAKDPRIMDTFPELNRASALIEKASQDLRSICHNLMPIEFETYTLTDIVKQAVERAATTSIRFEYIQIGKEQAFPPDYSLIIYRIINELINNIIKHSQADTAVTQLLFQPHCLVVSVEDDGKGFQRTETGLPATGIGLKNISSRAKYLGAQLDISWNQSGTCVTVEIPYASQPALATNSSPNRR